MSSESFYFWISPIFKLTLLINWKLDFFHQGISRHFFNCTAFQDQEVNDDFPCLCFLELENAKEIQVLKKVLSYFNNLDGHWFRFLLEGLKQKFFVFTTLFSFKVIDIDF